jgi:hypothetical protein
MTIPLASNAPQTTRLVKNISNRRSYLLFYIKHADLTTRPRKVFDNPNENIETAIANRAVSITGFRPMWSDS